MTPMPAPRPKIALISGITVQDGRYWRTAPPWSKRSGSDGLGVSAGNQYLIN